MKKIDLRSLHVPDDTPMMEALLGPNASYARSVADELDIYDAFADQRRTVAEVAQELALNATGLLLLCRILVNEGLMLESSIPGGPESPSFALTEVARAYWWSESPLYRGAESAHRHTLPQHERIADGLRSVEGRDNDITDMWEEGDVDPEIAEHFTEIMHSIMLGPALQEVRSGAFDDIPSIIDAGGGSGAFCASFASHYPGRRAVVMDLPPVLRVAREWVASYEGTEAVEFVHCDFFNQPWPTDAEAYHLSNILHDWVVPRCKQLLARCFEALPPGGAVFVHEALLHEDRRTPPITLLFHLSMFLNHGSQQFTYAELEELLYEAGFREMEIVHRFGLYSLVRGNKP